MYPCVCVWEAIHCTNCHLKILGMELVLNIHSYAVPLKMQSCTLHIVPSSLLCLITTDYSSTVRSTRYNHRVAPEFLCMGLCPHVKIWAAVSEYHVIGTYCFGTCVFHTAYLNMLQKWFLAMFA
jgi:hypothetical protein